MHWYIKKVSSIALPDSNILRLVQGHPVEENKPARFEYYTASLVSDGPPSRLSSEIFVSEDPQDKGAPVYRHDGMYYMELRSCAMITLLIVGRCQGTCTTHD